MTDFSPCMGVFLHVSKFFIETDHLKCYIEAALGFILSPSLQVWCWCLSFCSSRVCAALWSLLGGGVSAGGDKSATWCTSRPLLEALCPWGLPSGHGEAARTVAVLRAAPHGQLAASVTFQTPGVCGRFPGFPENTHPPAFPPKFLLSYFCCLRQLPR